jgi:signal transduction histidine kinase
VTQQRQALLQEMRWAGERLPLDVVRLEQFLDLQRTLLLAGTDVETLPDRLAQAVSVFLGVQGAAVGVVRDGSYHLLATYGVGADYHSRYEAAVLRDSPLGAALLSGRPIVLPEIDGRRQTLLLPFDGPELLGAVHLVPEADHTLTEHDLELSRVMTLLAGVALANAQQHRRLAQLARLKSDALTAMAHDLRAPLNALIGYAELLGDGAFGALTAEQREVSGTLERQALELVDLLGATLDVARLETGQVPLRSERFAVAEVLETLRAGTFAQATREGLLACRVSADLPLLESDRVKVKQILQNLVDNALKHGGRAPVEVEVTLAPDREAVRVTVRDRGPGIADDLLPNLFEPFRSGSPGGTGFGLYLVRSFAEALGGRVAARSLPGDGTAVTVELPLNARG